MNDYVVSSFVGCFLRQVNGISVVSPVVINGTRFGDCYNSTELEANGYPVYWTSEPSSGEAGVAAVSTTIVTVRRCVGHTNTLVSFLAHKQLSAHISEATLTPIPAHNEDVNFALEARVMHACRKLS